MDTRIVPALMRFPCQRAAAIIPFILLLVFLTSCSVLRKEGPEAVVKKYLDLASNDKTRSQAEEFTLQGGGVASATPSAGKSMPPVQSFGHMELEHMNAEGIPGATFTIGAPNINGTNATVPLNVKVGNANISIPVHCQQTDAGWRIDLAQTNREILRFEHQLNDAAAATTTSGKGGLGPVGSTQPAVPGAPR